MPSKLVDKILEKVPIPKELKETIEENVDLTKAVSKELYTHILGQGDKIKEELSSIIAQEVKEALSNLKPEELLKNVLEDMELDIKIKFKSKKKPDKKS